MSQRQGDTGLRHSLYFPSTAPPDSEALGFGFALVRSKLNMFQQKREKRNIQTDAISEHPKWTDTREGQESGTQMF